MIVDKLNVRSAAKDAPGAPQPGPAQTPTSLRDTAAHEK